ncbi:hypothetical protein ElyMa_000577900 [Elysia marginata]|uniref:Uncharacterized protein n=1 Tax=Elysia marginata TaxID=1093978 RepID=A0AAV4G3M3_9GAST|nr:hypothetical protein ElyMa_000577900 [Elysia marginata]
MFKPPVNHTAQKPKLPTNGAVSTPEVRRRSGANNAKEVPESEEPQLPGTPMPSPAKSVKSRPGSAAAAPVAEEPTTKSPTAPKSARKRLGSPRIAPSDQQPDKAQPPTQPDSTEMKTDSLPEVPISEQVHPSDKTELLHLTTLEEVERGPIILDQTPPGELPSNESSA